jgi:alkanesulfonate monooxygenase SsuD/methylene tetrahydromethanopterin reductase-like flavin-dependent oxidoreductase (luciferase family)
MGLSPTNLATFMPSLEAGAARAGRRVHDLAIQSSVQVRLTEDLAGTFAAMKPRTAMYIGGMGAKEANFHADAMARRGYADIAERIGELFRAGRRNEATAAVPDEYLDEGGLYGSADRIRERFGAWRDLGVTGLTVHTDQDAAIELMADVADLAPAE